MKAKRQLKGKIECRGRHFPLSRKGRVSPRNGGKKRKRINFYSKGIPLAYCFKDEDIEKLVKSNDDNDLKLAKLIMWGQGRL